MVARYDDAVNKLNLVKIALLPGVVEIKQ